MFRKSFGIILAIAIIVAVIMLINTRGNDISDVDVSGHELIGVWIWDGNINWQYEFKANGTGVRGMVGIPDEQQDFVWTTYDETYLRLRIEQRYWEEWRYTLRGYDLTLQNHRPFSIVAWETHRFRRADAPIRINYNLVGIWNWDDNALWQYRFNADGTGTMGLPDSQEYFVWSTPGPGHLRLDGSDLQGDWRGEWSYRIDGYSLTLESRQEANVVYVYIRYGAPPMINQNLVGVWNWDENELWQYHFNADGTGTIGLPDSLDTFRWSTPGPGHLRLYMRGYWEDYGEWDDWNYIIDGDVLVLESRHVADTVFRYTRVE